MTDSQCISDNPDRQPVLLVDDDRSMLDSMRRLLRHDYDVSVAESGEQALALFETCRPFTVIVSDLRMPGMDGVELLARTARKSPDTIRVLLTGFADLQAAMDAVNLGHVFRFLTKPCAPELIVLTVEAACRQARLERDHRELAGLKRCKKLFEGIIQGFSALVEARDLYLAGHQRRVAALAVAMAGEMDLPEEERQALRVAGLLHDIGKIYVPADFLNRPGALRPEERSIIQLHPLTGYEILKHLDEDWPVAVLIRQHHERLDGSGYPEGLKGGAIVRGARILAIADVVDAMCSHRPHRPSMGITAALAEIEAGRDSLYDRPAANACLRLFREKGYSLTECVDCP